MIKPVQNGDKSRADKASDHILQLIIDRAYRSGARLPNEYELATQLGVGRSTVREAIKTLVTQNVLEVRHGSGTFVSERVGEVPDPLGFRFYRDRKKLALELCEIRLMIEPPVAATAARNASADQVAAMQRLCDEVAGLYERNLDHNEKDIAFHVGIAEATGNSIAPKIISVLSTAITVITEVTEKKLMPETIVNHQKILDAIAGGNPSRAEQAMRRHIEYNLTNIGRLPDTVW